MHRSNDTTADDRTAARIVARYDASGAALRPIASPTAPPPDNGAGVHVERHAGAWRVRRTDGRILGRFSTRSEATGAAMVAAGWTQRRPALVLDVPCDPQRRAELLAEALEELAHILRDDAPDGSDVELARLFAAELGGWAYAVAGGAA